MCIRDSLFLRGRLLQRLGGSGVPVDGQPVTWQRPRCSWAVLAPAPKKRQQFLALAKQHLAGAHALQTPGRELLPPPPPLPVARATMESERQSRATAARFNGFVARVMPRIRDGQ
eukprot:11940146-Alexandrium_andersonii.AAC.1